MTAVSHGLTRWWSADPLGFDVVLNERQGLGKFAVWHRHAYVGTLTDTQARSGPVSPPDDGIEPAQLVFS